MCQGKKPAMTLVRIASQQQRTLWGIERFHSRGQLTCKFVEQKEVFT